MKRILLLLLCALGVRPALAQVELIDAFPNLPTFNRPLDLQHAGDGSGRLYVVEQQGIILSFENDPEASRVDTLLDIRHRVSLANAEEGLLGLAFHPNYEENGYFFIHYTSTWPVTSIVERYTRSRHNPLRADTTTRFVLLEELQPAGGHYGGQIAFGPDGYLYIALGDGECCYDPGNRSQDLTSPFGKLLRIDVDRPSRGMNYRIPLDNPYSRNREGYREEIYAYGLRNPWRFSFDAVTGDLWVGDVGEGRWEEVNLVLPGRNYGWSIMEGFQCFKPAEDCDTSGLEPPLWAYGRDYGRSITGGYVYRGEAVPELEGRYVFGDFGSGRIWALTYDPEAVTDSTSGVVVDSLLDTGLLISSFGVDEANELYVLSYTEGKIYALRASPSQSNEAPLPAPLASLEVEGPNPFAASTTIAFRVEQPAPVRLAVYDVLGREVAVLFEGTAYPGSPQRVVFEAGALPSGLYLCRMEAAGRVQTRTVILVR